MADGEADSAQQEHYVGDAEGWMQCAGSCPRKKVAKPVLQQLAQVLDVGRDGVRAGERCGEGVVLQVGSQGGLQKISQPLLRVGRGSGISDQDSELVCREGFNEGFRGRKVAVDGADADVGCLRDSVELERFPIMGGCARRPCAARTAARCPCPSCVSLYPSKSDSTSIRIYHPFRDIVAGTRITESHLCQRL
jgi:hypothetical protein